MPRTRAWQQHYPFVIGAVCGVLATGLVLPSMVEGRRGSARVAGVLAAPIGPVADGTATGSAGDPTTVEGASDQATTSDSSTDASSAAEAANLNAAGGGPAGAPNSAPTLGATDQGVSAERIKLGIVLTDATNPLGMDAGTSAEDVREQWQALIDDLNERGGVAGRKIDPVFRIAAILDKDQQRATCTRLAQDDKVFAVLDSGGATSAELAPCYVQYGLPLLGTGSPGLWDDVFANSRGLVFILHQRGSRQMRNFAARLAAEGRVKGKRCGVIGDGWQGASPRAAEMLHSELERRGCNVVRRQTLSADLATGSSQMPVAVQQMRVSGADSIWLLVNPLYATQFAQEAENQRYFPEYNLTDWLAGSIDFTLQNMPSGFFDRAAAVTAARTGEGRAGMPEIPEAAACRKIVEERTGTKLDRNDSAYGTPISACAELQIFAKAAGAAGTQLTRSAYVHALSRLGAFRPGNQSPGTFTPGKPDLADGVRILTARETCRCWVAVGPFHSSE